MNISIKVDSSQLEKAFHKAPVVVAAKLEGWVTRSAILTERSAKQHITEDVSRGSSGITRSSIHPVGLSTLGATIRPTNKYAYWVHEGRKPGKMPPWREGTDLNRWARRMGINPFLVARAIAKHGTKGHPFMNEAYKDVKSAVERDGQKVLSEIIGAL